MRRPAIGARGLTQTEAELRLARDGPNVLPVERGTPAWRHFLGQLFHFFAIMLWIAGGLAFLAGLPELGVAIFVVVVVNATFAFVQEYRAERAAERLRDLLPQRVTVVRDRGHVDIDAAELVVGDLVLLGPGDRVSADLDAVEAHALFVDTSTLTGESVPAPVDEGKPLHAGTFITEGEGAGVVMATGVRTRLAGIAHLTRAGRRPRPPLAIELHRVVSTIAVIAVGVGVAFFGLSLLLGTAPSEGFIFGVGVTVALVPEGLLPTVTLSLALGAQRMAARHALVRRLEAVETLGSTTFICTDKTGTLTMNEMSVVEVWTPAGGARIRGLGYEPSGEIDTDSPSVEPVLQDLALVGVRCSTGHVVRRDDRWVAQGDPMEAALDVLAHRVGARPAESGESSPDRRRFPFDARRRRMSIIAGDRVLVKGAPDAVLPLCTSPAGGVLLRARDAYEEMGSRGLRVLAMATRQVGETEPATPEEAESDLDLVGLVGLEDPPRPGAADAIAACRRAGIRVAMVTGDHPATALAIAREVGLSDQDEVVLSGAELPADEKELGELVDRDGIVLGRVEPEEKLRIARALRSRGQILAMTGDGVNDGPALQESDIGVAMGRSGTDVAREAADLVLLDDHFGTIVSAIEEGRAIFANIRRFLTYHLTDNVAELTPFLVWALSAGRIPLALGIMQILALDIGTDTLPAVALGAEPGRKGTLQRPPERRHLLDRRVAGRAFALLGPIEATMAMLAFFVTFVAAGWRPGEPFPGGEVLLSASGAAFAAVVIGQAANSFACRSTTRWPGSLGWFSNRMLVIAWLFEFVVIAMFLFVPVVADVMGHGPPSVAGWVVALLAAPAVLVGDGLRKLVIARRRARRGEPPHGP